MAPKLTSPCYHTQHQFMRALLLFPSYSQLIAEWPVAVLLLCLAVILLCSLAGLLGGHLPDFSKPLLVRGQGEGGGPQAWPPQLSLGQQVGVAQLGVGWQWWALSLQLGRWYRDDTPVQQSRQVSWPSLLQGLKGAEPRRPRWKTPPPTCLIFLLPQGFEPQDTDIGRKLVVWRALQTLTGSRKLLSLSPDLELNR